MTKNKYIFYWIDKDKTELHFNPGFYEAAFPEDVINHLILKYGKEQIDNNFKKWDLWIAEYYG